MTNLSSIRKIVGDLLIVAAVVYTFYLSVIMIHRINTVVLKANCGGVFLCELCMCVLMLIFATDMRFGYLTMTDSVFMKVTGWSVRVLVTAAVILFIFSMAGIRLNRKSDVHLHSDNAIVLGLALEDGKAPLDLQYRLDAAMSFLEDNPGSTLILTGGNPGSDGRTEAEVMRELLLERGVDDSCMILEDCAQTTKANFINTSRMIDPSEPVVLISSDYHIGRAVNIAREAGFMNVIPMASDSSSIAFGANAMWEVMLDLSEYVFGY